ncbi:hypothetical protein [Aquiflexum sp.]|uniref:hypothetical protein n=1 Tax=Aquiflexum sp. TaxID=1872584 RepID=UPI00359458B2
MDINEVLKEKLIAQNPKMGQILELMQQQNQTEKGNDSFEKLKMLNKKLTLALRIEIGKNKSLIQEMDELQEDYKFIDRINDDLASAVGACPNCWGILKDCEICDDNGGPGAYPVNKAAFIKFVLPIIKNTQWINQVVVKQSEG